LIGGLLLLAAVIVYVYMQNIGSIERFEV